MTKHPTETPEYWDELARNERAFAAADRARRTGSVESIKIHEDNAKEYEDRAAKLRSAEDGPEGPPMSPEEEAHQLAARAEYELETYGKVLTDEERQVQSEVEDAERKAGWVL